MHYWNQTRNTTHSLVSEHAMFEDYISCHKDSIYKEKMNMTLPLTSQKISFKVIYNYHHRSHGTHIIFLDTGLI